MNCKCVWTRGVGVMSGSSKSWVMKTNSKMVIDEDDEIEMDVEPPPKLKNFKEVIEALKDINHHYLENHGHIKASSMVGSAIDEIATLKSSACTKQTTICEFFY